MNAQAQQSRRRDLALIHIGAKAIGLDDDGYRLLLRKQFGVASSAQLDATGRARLIAHLKSKGFKPTQGGRAKVAKWKRARVAKITALWCALHDAGVVRNRSEAAMVKWCARVTGKARLHWATTEDLNRCIEGLKDWAHREGVRIRE